MGRLLLLANIGNQASKYDFKLSIFALVWAAAGQTAGSLLDIGVLNTSFFSAIIGTTMITLVYVHNPVCSCIQRSISGQDSQAIRSPHLYALHDSGPHVPVEDGIHILQHFGIDIEELPFVFDGHEGLAGIVVHRDLERFSKRSHRLDVSLDTQVAEN